MTRDTLNTCVHDTNQQVFCAFDALLFEWPKSPSAVVLDPFAQAARGVHSRASVAAFSLLFFCNHSRGVIPTAFYLLQTPRVFLRWLSREGAITGHSFLPLFSL